MKLTFLGATRTVTGSKYLVEYQNHKILVDCGLFQGLKEMRQRNWENLPISPAKIDAVVLTHAHIDHSGYIPVLIRNGFRGKIICSKATFDLCKILLPDSGFLQEEDAYQANKYHYTKHKPALPLYTEAEARESLNYFQTIDFGVPHYFAPDFYFTLSHAGHILGASFISVFGGNTSLVFSGDLGRPNDAVIRAPATLQYADYLLIESTYGDRLHKKSDPMDEMGEVIRKTAARGGKIIIPSFAVGRAQSILYYLYKLKEANLIPNIPIFLDSPMAISASELLHKYGNELHNDANWDKICGIAKYVKTVEESKSLDQLHVPAIIISASGMATGGRVLHHLKHHISDHKNTILFAGYQAEDTRGKKLVRGDKEIKIHGEIFPVHAEIANLESLSAHSDYEEILSWLGNFRKKPRKIFIVHGDLQASESLKQKIIENLGWNAIIPEFLQKEEL